MFTVKVPDTTCRVKCQTMSLADRQRHYAECPNPGCQMRLAFYREIGRRVAEQMTCRTPGQEK